MLKSKLNPIKSYPINNIYISIYIRCYIFEDADLIAIDGLS